MAGAGVWAIYELTAGRPLVREGAPSWSPDSARLAYYSEQANGKADLFTMRADGSDVTRLTSTPDADEGAPVFSPDGRRLLFDTDRDGNFEIYVMDLATRETRRLTTHRARDVAPAWSPDGARVAFMSDRASAPAFDVFLMDADGGNVERLTENGTFWFPQFSPDGRRLAFHNGRDVHVMDLATRTMRRLTVDPANGMYPTWSPDGRQIAFMSWRNGRTEIFVMDSDGQNQRRIVTTARGSAIDPRWSPDGTRVVFVEVPETQATDQQSATSSRAIYVLEIGSGRVTRLSR